MNRSLAFFIFFFVYFSRGSNGGRLLTDSEGGESPFNSSSHYEEVVSGQVIYTGAVLEYRPYDTWTEEEQGYGVVRRNAEAFVTYAEEAKSQGADILVTPEYGLQSLDMYYNDTNKFVTYAQYVPNPMDQIIPCSLQNESDHTSAVQILSCGAAKNSIYLVIDMAELSVCSTNFETDSPFPIEVSENCPLQGYFVYNTQVVFNREGAVVARYRKQNLYLEPYFNFGPKDDSKAIFVTDFNVAFSLEICFDIVYEHPAYSNVLLQGVRDVAMSTAWVDELAFDVADGIQNGWSRGLGTNLLVAGHHFPEYNMLGSGIFKSYNDQLPEYIYDRKSGNVLIVSTIATIPAPSALTEPNLLFDLKSRPKRNISPQLGSIEFSDSQIYNLVGSVDQPEDRLMKPILHTDISDFSRVVLEPGTSNQVRKSDICDKDNFCCHLEYVYTGNLTYMFVVNSGQNFLGNDSYAQGLQICGVVWCKSDNFHTCAVVELGTPEVQDTFGPFTLSSTTFSAEAIYPIGLHWDLSLVSNDQLRFTKDTVYSISSETPIGQPLTLALYGRWFGNDV